MALWGSGVRIPSAPPAFRSLKTKALSISKSLVLWWLAPSYGPALISENRSQPFPEPIPESTAGTIGRREEDSWESGDPISPVYAAKLREIQSVFNELKQLMKPESIGQWLLTDMDEFEGRSPADLIGKGETGRLWASLFYVRSGMPD